MNDFVYVERMDSRDIVIINWEVTLNCNYNCSYCAAHDNSEKYNIKYSENIIKFLKHICSINKKVLFILEGGEPTLWGELENFLKQVSVIPNLIITITTNGSASVRFFDKVKNYNIRWCISVHNEFCDINHLKKILQSLTSFKRKYNIDILLMTLPSDIHRNVRLAKELSKKFEYVSCMIKPIRDPHTNKLLKYPNAFKSIKKVYQSNVALCTGDNLNTSRLLVKDSKINHFKTTKQNLMLSSKNYFKGFLCEAGIKRIYIKQDGKLYRCTKEVGGQLGDLETGYVIPNEPIICTYEKACSCGDDLGIKKWREDDLSNTVEPFSDKK